MDLQLDDTPLATDWDDLGEMFKDIRRYYQETGENILDADDPGNHYTPWRVPRLGFVAQPSGKEWTITLPKARNSRKSIPDVFKTVAGRRQLLDQLMAGREPNLPRGIYKHFKGGLYRVLMLAQSSEDQSWQVIYEHLEDLGVRWVRPYAMWIEITDRWPDGVSRPRFVLETADYPLRPAQAT